MPKQIVPSVYGGRVLFCVLLIALATVSACTATPAISKQFRQEATLTLEYTDIRLNTDRYIGEKVILGGYILEITNQPDHSQLLILQAPLDSRNEPMSRDLSRGRFLVDASRFLDPEVYSPGRKVTVGGVVRGKEKQQIGEIDYEMPVIDSKELTLWAEDAEYYRPYWPYYPYYHAPYYFYRYPYRSPFKHPHIHP